MKEAARVKLKREAEELDTGNIIHDTGTSTSARTCAGISKSATYSIVL